MLTPTDLRKKPTAVKVNVSSGAGVDITWADGHNSHYDFAYLREECPCAVCGDQRHAKLSSQVEAPAANPLQMFKPKVAARAAKSVGHYALQIDFNDGHSAGIYSFDYLRTVCPCAECARLFR